ncbi:right-handed parallel beta-helix repeat-containing protein, partial [Candidatus Marithioploca araucensis]|nr:right-handed parallel beta-helix repeat-containing protein [Candidatus Marithioploca araucensis]
DLLLEQLHSLPDYPVIDVTVAAFFRFEDLLGNATLFFLHEIFRRDDRAKNTIAALQREGLLLDMRDVKATQEKILTRLNKQLDEQNAIAMQALKAGNFSQASQMSSQLERLQKSIKDVPENLQAAKDAWQKTHQQWVNFAARFDSWGKLLNSQISQVLAETETLHWEIEAVHDDVRANLAKSAEIADDVKALKQSMADLMARFDLSAQVKLSDEFTHHNSMSLKLIQSAITKLKALPHSHPDYNKVVLMGGSLLSSTGDIAAAEKLFLQAFNEAAPHSAEKALASFNLFLVRLRNKDYEQALVDLQTAIEIDRHYALHDIDKYPMIRLLGAGGMGSVFLCRDQWGEKQVVVKCFWEGRKGTRQAVFGEAMLMRQVAGAYVPAPLDCGYVDAHRQERPYFVSEYIEGALDGEIWLAQHGAFDVSTGIAVGIQIAKGLEVAHEKGIYHLDLKPANLLFKQTATGLMVKIIDFGLARVATSLRQEAMSRRTTAGMTQFGQAIMGTLLYAPPEQMGEERYGKPGAKSDFYAFGATLYRLMTNESPRTLNPRRLSDAPPELFDLLCHCKEENPRLRPKTAAEVVKRLETIFTAMTIVVSPTGNCQTISAAIKKAKAGDRILIKPGVYQEDLVIDKPLKIIGDGEVADIVVESQNASCITMKTDHALVRGLSLRNRAEKRYAVDMPQGQFTLEYCDITSDTLACVGIHGSETEGIVSHCQIHDGKDPGIMVYENGTGRIENCDIFGNAFAGIEIKTGGNHVIQHCQIHDNKQGGIYVYEDGKGRIENCDIFGNALAGIEIKTGGNPVIQHCQIHDGKGPGIFVNENGTGRIENCEIFGNAYAGIQIREGSNPVIQHCQIHDNQGGIFVNENGKGRIENCDIFGNAFSGIQIREGSNPVIQHCQIHDNQGGIFVNENGKGRIENCEIFGNAKAGITISEGGNPVIQHCQIHDNQGGIFVNENGTGQIESCEIFGNADVGMEIKTGSNPLVKNCQIHDNKNKNRFRQEVKEGGVVVWKNGKGRIENCNIFGNTDAGIAITEGGNPVIQKCTIKQNGYEAVWVYDGGAGTIENCDLRDNAKGAWDIESGCQVRRSGNKE